MLPNTELEEFAGERLVPEGWKSSVENQITELGAHREKYPGYPDSDKYTKWDQKKIEAWNEAGRPLDWFPQTAEPVEWEDEEFQTKLSNWSNKRKNDLDTNSNNRIQAYLDDDRTWGMTEKQIEAWNEAGRPDEFENLSASYDFPLHYNYLDGLALKQENPEKYGYVYSGEPLSDNQLRNTIHPNIDKLLEIGVPVAVTMSKDGQNQPWMGFYWDFSIDEFGREQRAITADPVYVAELDIDGSSYVTVLLIDSKPLEQVGNAVIKGLPGGMKDKSDPTSTETADREAAEETGISVDEIKDVTDPISLCLQGPVIESRTGVFTYPVTDAWMRYLPLGAKKELQPGDDAVDTGFFIVNNDLKEELFSPTHWELILAAVVNYQNQTGNIVLSDGKIIKKIS